MKKTEMKPCPFCGGEASMNVGRPETYSKDGYMVHHQCSLFGNMHTYWFTYKKDAINAWNRRSQRN
jgi:Lar family restriction alleviation protein